MIAEPQRAFEVYGGSEMFRQFFKFFPAVIILCFLVSASAYADTVIIDMGTGLAPSGGVIQLSGGNATGTDIPIDSLSVAGAPTGNGVYDLSGSALSSDSNGAASLDFNTSANTVTITGGVPGLGITDNSTVLLTGSFTSFTVTPNGIFGATRPDTKSALLLAALGLPANTQFEYFGFSLTGLQTGTDTYTAISTDFKNTATVPDPGSGALLAIGGLLLGLALTVGRKIAPLRVFVAQT